MSPVVCPICGAKDRACHGDTPYFDPPGMEVLNVANIETKKKPAYPQQYVRPGRGVAGYQGDVTVLPMDAKSVPTLTVQADEAKAKEAAGPSYSSMNRAELNEAAKQAGIEGYEELATRADVIAALEAANA